MPRGDKSAYTDKQKRQAEHIEEGYEHRGVPEDEAERRAWATVNKETGGGKKSGSGRGKAENHAPSRKSGKLGGKAAESRPAKARSASAKKAAATRKRKAAPADAPLGRNVQSGIVVDPRYLARACHCATRPLSPIVKRADRLARRRDGEVRSIPASVDINGK